MELGTTKELDIVGEDAFDCADSLQRIDSFRSIWLAKSSLLQSSSPRNLNTHQVLPLLCVNHDDSLTAAPTTARH